MTCVLDMTGTLNAVTWQEKKKKAQVFEAQIHSQQTHKQVVKQERRFPNQNY